MKRKLKLKKDVVVKLNNIEMSKIEGGDKNSCVCWTGTFSAGNPGTVIEPVTGYTNLCTPGTEKTCAP